METKKIKFKNGSEAEAKAVRFSIDGGYDNTGFDGYHIEGRRWNGWLQPYVTRETFLQIIAECITPVMDIPNEKELMLEWFEGDDYVNGIPSADDKPDTECGLYAVWWGWCWDEQAEKPCDSDYTRHRQSMGAA